MASTTTRRTRTSSRSVLVLLVCALLGPLLLAAPAAAVVPTVAPSIGCGDYTSFTSGWAVYQATYSSGSCTPTSDFTLVWDKPAGSVTSQSLWRECANGAAATVLGPYNGDSGTRYSYNTWGCSGSHVVKAEVRHSGTPVLAWTLAAPDPLACEDGDVTTELDEWGGYGGGGAWGASNDEGQSLWELVQQAAAESRNPLLLWKNLQDENPEIVEAYQTYEGWFWATYDDVTGDWSLWGSDGEAVNKDAVGFGGYGGGGAWGIGCDADDDQELDVPSGATAPVVVTVSEPPAEIVPDVPSGGCDFGLLDPSSWLCSLGGLLGKLLDAVRAVLGMLRWLVQLPPDGYLGQKAGELSTAFSDTPPAQVGAVVGDVIGAFDGFDATSSCQGPSIPWSVFHVPAADWHPFDACAAPMSTIAGWVRLVAVIGIWGGALLAALSIVAGAFGVTTPWDGSELST